MAGSAEKGPEASNLVGQLTKAALDVSITGSEVITNGFLEGIFIGPMNSVINALFIF